MLLDDQGRLFEVGFNLGILAHLQTIQPQNPWLDFYLPDVARLRFDPLLKQLIDRVKAVSTVNQDIIEQWAQLILLRGFLGGINFWREYLNSLGFNKPEKLARIDFLYYQCSFINDNSLNINEKDNNTSLERILKVFREKVKWLPKNQPKYYLEKYQKQGEFLKADTLILLRYKKSYRMVVVDTSIFAFQSENLDLVNLIKSQLGREINYLKSKSVFARLRIDTGKEGGVDFAFSEELKEYFKAFGYQDKESSKLIQAGSYGYSFYRFLQGEEILSQATEIVISAIGYSDRHLSSLTVTPQNLQLLETCYQIYSQINRHEDPKVTKEKVLKFLQDKAAKSFLNGKSFLGKLFAISPIQSTLVTHQETLTEFANTAKEIPAAIATAYNLPSHLSLRDGHSQLIKQALQDPQLPYLFLTGNPGIGKTTAIVESLKEYQAEGFLFIYVSPRIQVNLDILEKFKHQDQLFNDQLFCLYTNSSLLGSPSQPKYLVNYLSNQQRGDFVSQGVKFLDAWSQQNHPYQQIKSLARIDRETLKDNHRGRPGVIAAVSEAIYTLIKQEITNQIVATFSIQALKKTQNGHTLEHLKKIFQAAFNTNQNRVIPSEMQAISRRIKHIWFMIDEITGSQEGVNFLKELRKFFQDYNLFNSPHGFNSKIIVADASLVDKDVIAQHLQDDSPEPDKIFFRQAKNPGVPLSRENFQFAKKPAVIINANSYPAQSLDLTYKIIVSPHQFREEDHLQSTKDNLQKTLSNTLVEDIKQLQEKPGQILVYIQDKKKLQQLIEALKLSLEDYLEVHGDLPDQEKQTVQARKNKVKIIFMTSSGSRGLSFPFVKHILVNIPNFQVEQNLMEIIQVIYRGRGDQQIDQQSKQISFYLAVQTIYYHESDRQQDLQKSLIHILNMLLIIKGAILTRIQGSVPIGRKHFVIIPIGGKSLNSAGENFSSRLNSLLYHLKNAYRLSPQDSHLEQVHKELKNLLQDATFTLSKPANDIISYLGSLDNFQQQFYNLLNAGFDKLLTLGNLEFSYLVGSLIVLPIQDQTLKNSYLFALKSLLNIKLGTILKQLKAIQDNPNYQNNLRQATQIGIELLKELEKETEYSQSLEENSNYFDQYYILPVFVLLYLKPIENYLNQEEEPENCTFRDLLYQYIRAIYTVNDVLPIGDKYGQFPFLIFRSYSLKEIREKMFTEAYLLNSTTLNIVNLILAN